MEVAKPTDEQMQSIQGKCPYCLIGELVLMLELKKWGVCYIPFCKNCGLYITNPDDLSTKEEAI